MTILRDDDGSSMLRAYTVQTMSNRAIGALLVLGACSGPGTSTTSPKSVDAVTFAYRVPPVGTTWTEDRSTKSDLVLEVEGKKTAVVASESLRLKIEVLAVSAEVVTRAKYTYLAVEDHQIVDGKDETTRSPLVGKTYVLEAGNPTSVSLDGAPASPHETEEVRKNATHFGKPRFGHAVVGKTFAKDKKVELDEATLREADEELSRMSLTFQRMDGPRAVFAVEMGFQRTFNGADMSATAAGNLVLDPKTGDLYELHATGKMEITGKITGSGTITLGETDQR